MVFARASQTLWRQSLQTFVGMNTTVSSMGWFRNAVREGSLVSQACYEQNVRLGDMSTLVHINFSQRHYFHAQRNLIDHNISQRFILSLLTCPVTLL